VIFFFSAKISEYRICAVVRRCMAAPDGPCACRRILLVECQPTDRWRVNAGHQRTMIASPDRLLALLGGEFDLCLRLTRPPLTIVGGYRYIPRK